MKIISTTFPWDIGPPEKTVEHARALNCQNVCIRTPNGPYPYGVDNETRQRWNGKTHDDLERAVKTAGLGFSLWPVVYFRLWKQEADAIKEAVVKYNPTALFLDAEVKKNVANLGSFLRALGRLPRPLYLQSFRRANYHNEMMWRKWYSYRDLTTGEFIVDGFGHQLYPIGWNSERDWINQFKADIASHEREAAAIGRKDMPWFPTMPTFVSGGFEGVSGWQPTVDAFMGVVEWMVDTLGERLLGLNFWSLDRHLMNMPELYQAISELKLPGQGETAAGAGRAEDVRVEMPGAGVGLTPTDTTSADAREGTAAASNVDSLEEWAAEMDAWARKRGYNGPPPPRPGAAG